MVRTAVKFGLFVVVCTTFTLLLAATIGNTTILGLFPGGGADTYTIEASFDDATGLLLDDNVKVAGVPIGKVTSISVENGQAKVKMAIRSDSPPLSADTAAQVRWRNLIGQRYVYLLPGDAPTTLGDGSVIDSTISVVDLGELFNRLGPIVGALDSSQINDFLETVSQALDGNQASVAQTLEDLAVLVNGLGDRDAAIGRLLVNLEIVAETVADRDAQLQQVFDNLIALAQTFSDNTTLLETALDEMGALNTDLSALLLANRGEIDSILTDLDTTLGTVEANLPELDTALGNLPAVAEGVFTTSRNGEFLNQDILCASVGPPPCPTPIIDLDDTLGVSSTSAAASFDDPVWRLFRGAFVP